MPPLFSFINAKYNGTSPRDAVKILTKLFAKFRNDRALREVHKSNRIYYRVNEPHKSGTPHTHILFYVPKENAERIINAFKRLYPKKGNDIQFDIQNSTAYIMKYINKTLPNSKTSNLSKKSKYLNAWYAQHGITRFSSSRTLAPLYLYRLLYRHYSLKALTVLHKTNQIKVFRSTENLNKIMEIFENDDIIYMKNENYAIERHYEMQGRQ